MQGPQLTARIRRQALARVDRPGLLMHRLTQAIVRDHLTPDVTATTKSLAAAVLVASRPGGKDLPATWPAWSRLLPHLLAVNPDASRPALSTLTDDAVWYLIRRATRAAVTNLPGAYTGSVWTRSVRTIQLP